jgi:purine nucleoside permease
MNKRGCRTLWLLVWLTGLSACARPADMSSANAAEPKPRPVKVLIVNMFKPEGEIWSATLGPTEAIAIPGLSPDYPTVRCNADDVCQLTTGMGHANAAASVAALVFSRRFDLSRSYVLIAGIAGIDPEVGTIGSAAWARYVVSYGIQHEIDAREMPAGWPSGYFGIRTTGPDDKPPLNYRTEVFQLDEGLLQWGLALSRTVALDDNDTARAYRAQYSQAAARQPPSVIQCDTVSNDTYWHGNALGARASAWTKILTDGKGTYCTTQQEDNATVEALDRGAAAGLLDLRRVAVLRAGANFDRPHPGQSAYDSVKSNSGGFRPAVNNLVRAGAPLVAEIVSHWNAWSVGIPAPR